MALYPGVAGGIRAQAGWCHLSVQEFQTWLDRGAPLVQNHKQAKWALGDWLLEAENQPFQWPHQGQGVPPSLWLKAAAEHYGYKYDTFLQFMRLARTFPPATRVAALSWHHHQAVAAIADPAVRADWLSNAALRQWPAKELQARVSVTKHGLSVQEGLQVASLAAALNIDNNQVQVLMLREFLQQVDLATFIQKHAKAPAATEDEVLDASEACGVAAPEDGVALHAEALPAIPTTGALPNVELYAGYLARGKKYMLEVLVPGGLAASNGTTVSAKFKKYFLVSTGKTELREITVPQWELLWAQLDALANEGNDKAVAAVEATRRKS